MDTNDRPLKVLMDIWEERNIYEVRIPYRPDLGRPANTKVLAACNETAQFLRCNFKYCQDASVTYRLDESIGALIYTITTDYSPFISIYGVLVRLVFPIFDALDMDSAPEFDGTTGTMRIMDTLTPLGNRQPSYALTENS